MPATSITGAAGAYYAAGELSAREWAVGLMIGNSPRIDLTAQHPQGRHVAAIQVKASRSGDFDVGTLAEREPSPPTGNEWFILVDLQKIGSRPVFFVVPWNHVGAIAHLAYKAWLRSPGRGGRQRKPHNRRTLAPREFKGYREAWELLDCDAYDVDVARLPPWIWGWYEELGLPAGFPPMHRAEGEESRFR